MVLHTHHYIILHCQSGCFPDGGEDGLPHRKCRRPGQTNRNCIRNPRFGINKRILPSKSQAMFTTLITVVWIGTHNDNSWVYSSWLFLGFIIIILTYWNWCTLQEKTSLRNNNSKKVTKVTWLTQHPSVTSTLIILLQKRLELYLSEVKNRKMESKPFFLKERLHLTFVFDTQDLSADSAFSFFFFL